MVRQNSVNHVENQPLQFLLRKHRRLAAGDDNAGLCGMCTLVVIR
jgi:hypothetical protein